MEDFHLTKAREVRDQLTKIGAGLSRASEGTALKRAALAAAQKELDTATSLEAKAKRDVDRLTFQQGELEAFMHTTQRESREMKGQRDRAAKKVKEQNSSACGGRGSCGAPAVTGGGVPGCARGRVGGPGRGCFGGVQAAPPQQVPGV